jgi:hypothetical protein
LQLTKTAGKDAGARCGHRGSAQTRRKTPRY